MPKKSPAKSREQSSSKYLDPAITVALIALAGTLITALLSSPVIIAWIQRTPVPELQPSVAAPSSPADTQSISPTSESQNEIGSPAFNSPVSTADGESCLSEYFADVDPSKQINIESGVSAQDYFISNEEFSSQDAIGPLGVKLSENNKMVAALKFLFFIDSELFRIASLVDGNCQPVTEYSNTLSGEDPNAIEGSGGIQLDLNEGSFTLGFTYSGIDFIRFSFRKLN